jgi:amino acid adenylation domain-containing protein
MTHTGILFTDGSNRERISNNGNPLTEDIDTVITDDLFSRETEPLHEGKDEIGSDGEDQVYIYFTSGTTGTPNAFIGKNRSLLQFIQWEIETFLVDSGVRVSQLSAVGFDAVLRDIFIPLCTGGRLMIPENRYTILDGEALREWLDKTRITLVHCVPALFRLLNTRELTVTHLKYLEYIVLSGERVHPREFKNWFDIFGQRIRLVNLCGTSETTLAKTVFYIGPPDVQRPKIPIGKAIKGSQLLILDKKMKICGTGIVGEIYIRTPYLTFGYNNDPQLTHDRFIVNPLSGDPGDLLHRTGDLGRLLPDGNIDLLGRIDRQVKIRGIRVEPGEVENILLKHPAVKEAAVIVRTDQGAVPGLAGYVVPVDPMVAFDASMFKDYISAQLPDYMVPDYFVRLDKMPLTPNGKVDQKALPEPEPGGTTGGYTAPGNKLEEKIVEIWSEILNIKKEILSIDANFFRLGGHSLRAAILAARMHKAFSVKIPMADIFNSPTIRGLSGCISAAGKEVFAAITLAEEKEFYELSFNQKRLWMIHQLQEGGISYNMTYRVNLTHKVDVSVIEKTLVTMIERHESLRTSFKEVNHQPRQFIAKPGNVDIPLKVIDISSLEITEKQEKRETIYREVVKTPFILSRAPLFRAVLIRLENLSCDFLFSLHHIVTDGWSMEILEKEFTVFYEGYRTGREQKQEPLNTRYKDFAQWHNRQISDERLTGKSSAFWEKKIEEGFPLLKLPADFNVGADERQGAGYLSRLAKEIAINTGKAAEEHNTTVFTVMFALYLLWLHRFSGQRDIVCSIINAGREYEELFGIVGFFVNAVLFKTRVDPNERFFDFLDRVHKEVIDVFQHQAYPPELVFKAHHMRYPDIPVSFNMFNIVTREEPEQPVVYRPGHLPEAREVKYDIEPYIKEYKEHINIYWVYKKAIFTPAAIEYMVEEYTKIAHFFTKNIDKSYDDYKNSNQKRTFNKN